MRSISKEFERARTVDMLKVEVLPLNSKRRFKSERHHALNRAYQDAPDKPEAQPEEPAWKAPDRIVALIGAGLLLALLGGVL